MSIDEEIRQLEQFEARYVSLLHRRVPRYPIDSDLNPLSQVTWPNDPSPEDIVKPQPQERAARGRTIAADSASSRTRTKPRGSRSA